jgi:N-acetylglucosaminyldiphosphoundecaprenol N-acetyl-beta-D-mannosaminyltransferase
MLLNKISSDFNIESLNKVNTTQLYSFLNPYSYCKIRNNKNLYNELSFFYCDGLILAKMMTLTRKKCKRVSFDFTSLATIIFKHAEDYKKTIYIIGGKTDIANNACNVFKKKFPNLKIIGIHEGFFQSIDEKKNTLENIVKLSPDIVIAGLGTIHQEQFLIDLKNNGWIGIGFTCGGFLHQTANKNGIYYPIWIDKTHLRWLYRIFDEPKLAKRYLTYYPIFFIYFFKDIISMYLKR